MWLWIGLPIVFLVGTAAGVALTLFVITASHPLPNDPVVDASIKTGLPILPTRPGLTVPSEAWTVYRFARGMMETASARFGLEIGSQMVLSGIGRQLRADFGKAGSTPAQALASAQKTFSDMARDMTVEAEFDAPMDSDGLSPLN